MENNLRKLLENEGINEKELLFILRQRAKTTNDRQLFKYIDDRYWQDTLTDLLLFGVGESNLNIRLLFAICDYFNCSLDYLFKRTDIRVKI
jgi:hypothetical protein